MTTLLPAFSLEGKTALITGASRGIGFTLARGLAQAGATVVAAGRDIATLDEAVRQLQQWDTGATGLLLDVSHGNSITQAFSRFENAPLDILINNAGTEQICPSLEVDETLWQRIVDTNLKGAFFCAQAAARLMAHRHGGCMINICSLTSQVGVPGAAAYGASKAGLVGLTHTLSSEWAKHGIRINGIGPGYFNTDLTQVFYQDPQWCDAMLSKIPLGRFGELDDLIGAAVFLSSDAARYITGQVLYVDGGYLASV